MGDASGFVSQSSDKTLVHYQMYRSIDMELSR